MLLEPWMLAPRAQLAPVAGSALARVDADLPVGDVRVDGAAQPAARRGEREQAGEACAQAEVEDDEHRRRQAALVRLVEQEVEGALRRTAGTAVGIPPSGAVGASHRADAPLCRIDRGPPPAQQP